MKINFEFLKETYLHKGNIVNSIKQYQKSLVDLMKQDERYRKREVFEHIKETGIYAETIAEISRGDWSYEDGYAKYIKSPLLELFSDDELIELLKTIKFNSSQIVGVMFGTNKFKDDNVKLALSFDDLQYDYLMVLLANHKKSLTDENIARIKSTNPDFISLFRYVEKYDFLKTNDIYDFMISRRRFVDLGFHVTSHNVEYSSLRLKSLFEKKIDDFFRRDSFVKFCIENQVFEYIPDIAEAEENNPWILDTESMKSHLINMLKSYKVSDWNDNSNDFYYKYKHLIGEAKKQGHAKKKSISNLWGLLK